MRKWVKILIAVIAAVVLLAGCGLWSYLRNAALLEKYLLEGEWESCYLEVSAGYEFRGYVVDEKAAQEIRTILSETKLRRVSSVDCAHNVSYGVFINNSIHNLILAVRDDGTVSLTVLEPGTNREEACYYFTGGDELYQQLRTLSFGLKVFVTT